MKDDITGTISFCEFKHSKEFFDLKISRKYFFFVFFVLIFVITFFIWASIFEFDVVKKGNAVIRPKNDVSVIKLFNSGVVSEKKYINGSFVNEGDFLFSLNTNVVSTEIENTKMRILRNQQMYDSLIDLENMLEHDSLVSDKSEASVRANVFFSQKRIKELNFEKIDNLYQSEISLPPELTYKQKILELRNERDIAKSDLENFVANFRYSIITEKNSILNEKESLEQTLEAQKEILSNSIIVATKSGIIEELTTFSVGDFLCSGENILRIVPLYNESIRAQICLSQSEILDVKIGQQVKIKLLALNSNEYGQVMGSIVRIGVDSLYDTEKKPFYQIEADIPKYYLENKKGDIFILKPGMTGLARIVVRKKKLISYIAEKLSFK